MTSFCAHLVYFIMLTSSMIVSFLVHLVKIYFWMFLLSIIHRTCGMLGFNLNVERTNLPSLIFEISPGLILCSCTARIALLVARVNTRGMFFSLLVIFTHYIVTSSSVCSLSGPGCGRRAFSTIFNFGAGLFASAFSSSRFGLIHSS